MYQADVWDLDVAGGAPVEALDWTGASEPGDVPATGGADVTDHASPAGTRALALGLGLLFIFGLSHAAAPRS